MASLQRTLTRLFSRAPITGILVAACCLAYLLTAAQSRSLLEPLRNSSLAQNGMLYAPVMHEPIEWLRAITAMFLHLDPTHLLFNMFMLILIGRELERGLGSLPYLGVYLASGVGGALAVMLQAPLSPTVGASGALYGLMAVLTVQVLRGSGQVTPVLVLIAVNFGYSLITPNISLWGHTGGFIAGSALAAVLYFAPRRRLAPLAWGLFAVEFGAVALVGNAILG